MQLGPSPERYCLVQGGVRPLVVGHQLVDVHVPPGVGFKVEGQNLRGGAQREEWLKSGAE